MFRTTLMLLLLAVPLAAWPESRDQLVQQYSDFAGSEANSKSLVDGLRNGKEVTLTNADGTTKETFTPATGTMGNGNVKIALALAEADLKKAGVTNPTPTQLRDEMTKILDQRAGHEGWGRIAQSLGFKLGDVMRADKAERQALERQARADRLERQARVDKPEKPERPERPERHGRGPH
jgi:hypothetical protein